MNEYAAFRRTEMQREMDYEERQWKALNRREHGPDMIDRAGTYLLYFITLLMASEVVVHVLLHYFPWMN